MTEVENLRKMNVDKNRTDVENLFLKEMVENDAMDFFKEDSEFDAFVPGETTSLFDDSTSAEFDDTLDADEALDGFTMREIF